MPYIPHTSSQIKEMLQDIGVKSIEDLFSSVPSSIRIEELLLPSGLSEEEVKREIERCAKKIRPLSSFNSFLGAGLYSHYIPSALSSLVFQPQFLTAYTPYQPEVSQGILQALFEYQSYICILTGMDVSNASLYDGATSLSEAILMSLRINKKEVVLLSKTIHPEYREVVYTYLKPHGIVVKEIPYEVCGLVDIDWIEDNLDDASCVCIQSPNFFGLIEDLQKLGRLLERKQTLFILVTNPGSLAVLKEPALCGVDIVCGEGQPLGGMLSLGGNTFGFIATKNQYLRQLPGRIVGATTDREGKRAFCLTLQTREQHIRREKATSNICTNHSLGAIGAAIYLSLLGREGFKELAIFSMNLAHYLFQRLKELGEIEFPFDTCFFNEFIWKIDNASLILKELYKRKIIAGFPIERFYPELKNCILSFCSEIKRKEDIDEFVEALKSII